MVCNIWCTEIYCWKQRWETDYTGLQHLSYVVLIYSFINTIWSPRLLSLWYSSQINWKNYARWVTGKWKNTFIMTTIFSHICLLPYFIYSECAIGRARECIWKAYENFNFFTNLSEIDTNKLKNIANKLVDRYPDNSIETLGTKDSSANMKDERSAQNICNVLHSRNLRDVYPNVDIEWKPIYVQVWAKKI